MTELLVSDSLPKSPDPNAQNIARRKPSVKDAPPWLGYQTALNLREELSKLRDNRPELNEFFRHFYHGTFLTGGRVNEVLQLRKSMFSIEDFEGKKYVYVPGMLLENLKLEAQSLQTLRILKASRVYESVIH